MHFTTQTIAGLGLSFSFLLLSFPSVLTSPVASQRGAAALPASGPLLVRDEDVHDFHLKDDDDGRIYAEVERTFGVIHDIPDAVLEAGDEALQAWKVDHGHQKREAGAEALAAPAPAPELPDRSLLARGWWEVTKCAGAIAAFIASNAIGAAKLLRIKKYIEALGGVKKSAELLLKASTNAERLKEGGEALALLAGEILGTSLVANNC